MSIRENLHSYLQVGRYLTWTCTDTTCDSRTSYFLSFSFSTIPYSGIILPITQMCITNLKIGPSSSKKLVLFASIKAL